MTEEEWLACGDPEAMVGFLGAKESNRKIRLFGAACCRAAWLFISESRSRRAVEATELYADGLLAEDKWASAAYDALRAREAAVAGPLWACSYLCAPPHSMGSWDDMPQAVVRNLLHSVGDRDAVVKAAQASLLRDVFSPFRASALVPEWVTLEVRWLIPDVTSLAAAAYEGRRLPSGELEPDRLAVLSDALEEVGCHAKALLSHLRSPGPHVRGCWALDLCLGLS